jgi:hypothetical protein
MPEADAGGGIRTRTPRWAKEFQSPAPAEAGAPSRKESLQTGDPGASFRELARGVRERRRTPVRTPGPLSGGVGR